MSVRYDVAVIGAGVFGAWTAWHLARRGKRVLLADAYGPGNARGSSAGESRIIRMGYGADELYTRWSVRSLAQWKEFLAAAGQRLFHETGGLWRGGDLRGRGGAAGGGGAFALWCSVPGVEPDGVGEALSADWIGRN